MKISLRNKFLWPTVTLLVLSLGVSTVVSYLNAADALLNLAESQMMRMVEGTDRLLQAWLTDRKMNIKGWSQQRLFRIALMDNKEGQEARKHAMKQLALTAKDYKYYEAVLLVNPKGDIVAADDAAIVGKINLKKRGYFKEAMQGRMVVTDVLKSLRTGNPIFAVAAPVRQEGRVVGVFAGVVDMKVFADQFVTCQRFGKSGLTFLVGNKGIIIAHPVPRYVLKVNVLKTPGGERLMSKPKGILRYSWQGVQKVMAFQSLPNNWRVVVTANASELSAAANHMGYINLIIALVAIVLAGMIVFFIARSLTGPLNRIIHGLDEGASQVSGAAGELASSAQTLAEGSGEQASALEESSASLEEMASMTRQNADHAKQADNLMVEANRVVEEASNSMSDLTNSMEAINQATSETSKIIKTIDEIAFQTNLLALNAAVEAARAGEAGAGFAVVADEVRNLAMRAAEAAKNTTELIEGTVRQVHEGSDIVQTTVEAFEKVAASAGKVGELVGEIAAASGEQSQGIDQVNRAVAEMDKLTQQNAASAEESASSSEMMLSQAQHMKDFVAELVVLVRGGGIKREQAPAAAPVRSKAPRAKQKPQLASRRALPAPAPAPRKKTVEDDDFMDF